MTQYTLSFSSTSLSINQCHFISHVFERSGFITDVIKAYVVELYVFRGVVGCLWSSAI